MTQIKTPRIQSLDLLKGLVMIIMALDHTRDYFHADAFLFNPTDPTQSNLPIFFTRWITHFCAPAFSFLAGTSAYLVGMRKSKKELSIFLIKRGLWLIFIELTIVNFGWLFNINLNPIALQVIWVLGLSMLLLAFIIYMNLKLILLFSLLVIIGHNGLDNIHIEGNILWSLLHELNFFSLGNDVTLIVAYPILPWVGVMSLGYYFGQYYQKTISAETRQKLFSIIGIMSLLAFFIIRYFNGYGNPNHWSHYASFSQTIISFFAPLKYPPSLSYLLMTLSMCFIFLSLTEKASGKIVDKISVFGKVPFFYYIIHIYVIHLLAMVFAQATGFGWRTMILDNWVTDVPALKGYGVSLEITYLIWLGIVILLYPFCLKFSRYKLNNKQKWWLSYL